MTQDLRLHSCRLCGAPLLRAFKHLQDHLLARHGLGVRAYRHLQGERALEETGEEARVKGLGRDRRQRGFTSTGTCRGSTRSPPTLRGRWRG